MYNNLMHVGSVKKKPENKDLNLRSRQILTQKDPKQEQNALPRYFELEFQVNFKHINVFQLTCVHTGVKKPVMYLYPALAGGSVKATGSLPQSRKSVCRLIETDGLIQSSLAARCRRDIGDATPRYGCTVLGCDCLVFASIGVDNPDSRGGALYE